EIVGVRQSLGMPAVRLEAFADVLGRERKVSAAINCDVIVVIYVNDVAQAQMPGNRCRFTSYTFHQITVAYDRKNARFEERRISAGEADADVLGSDCHPDAITKALPQGPRRSLDTGGQVILRMPRGSAANLPKLFDILKR